MSVFKNKEHRPGHAEIAAMLGRPHRCWQKLKMELGGTEKWSYPGKKQGWSLALRRGKRTVLYLIPERKHFRVGFALGGKAVAAANESDLPAPVLEIIENAPRYAEGRGVHLDVRYQRDLPAVLRLAQIKMEH